jgi:putative hemolysin
MIPKKLSSVLVLIVVFVALAGCTSAADEATVTPTPGVEAPAGVVRARDSVLRFLRADVSCCVPPDGVAWRTAEGQAPDGFRTYLFHTEETLMTVAYALNAADPDYHVGFTNAEFGFCWQAIVDSQGKVVGSGTAAELWPALADAAESSCTAGGYDYAVEDQPDGTSCGVCTLPDGSHCKAWLFYQGECTPDEG